jgi:hypothetical protein
MRPSLSGAVSNGGSGGTYEKNCNLINIEKKIEVNPVKIRKHPPPLFEGNNGQDDWSAPPPDIPGGRSDGDK